MSNSKTALNDALVDIEYRRSQIGNLVALNRQTLDDVRELLIGRRMKCFGKVYQVCTARITSGGAVRVYGVIVRGKKIGTRGFDLGNLDNAALIED